MDTRKKIVAADRIQPSSNLAVAFGRFDVLTVEHCRALASAASSAQPLIALVQADSDPPRALLDETSRAQLVAGLGAVNHVVICDRTEREKLLASWRPATVIDVESEVRRDVVADVISRHRRK